MHTKKIEHNATKKKLNESNNPNDMNLITQKIMQL